MKKVYKKNKINEMELYEQLKEIDASVVINTISDGEDIEISIESNLITDEHINSYRIKQTREDRAKEANADYYIDIILGASPAKLAALRAKLDNSGKK